MRLRVLTYNIRSGTDILGRPRLAQQADTIRAATPDVVFLQEVAGARQAERIAALAALGQVAYGGARRGAAGRLGNVILSRWPLSDIENRPVPRARVAVEPRAVLAASVVPTGRQVRTIGTHFGLLPGEPEDATAVVLAMVAATSGPVVLGGDFNRPSATARSHRRLRAVLTDCASADGRVPRATFPSPRPVLRLDYLYVRDCAVCDVEVLSSVASDHRPLLAVLEV